MAQQIIIKGTPVTAANEVLVADSNSKIPAVDGSQVTAMSGTNVSTGTVATARLDTGTTANKIVVLDGTAKVPAVDGSLLTGIVSYTKNASDPTVSTNPSGGVGTEWVNHTSGKQFICTDATTGANVWKISGGHSGDIKPYYPYGEISGYACGGYTGSASSDVIDKFSFTSDGSATDVGNMTLARHSVSGSSSATHGYTHGGYYPSAWADRIDRFSFSVDGNSTDVGNLFVTTQSAGASSSETHGYLAGGGNSTTPADQGINGIEKFAYAALSNGTDVGNLTMQVMSASATSSLTHGYRQGGRISGARHDVIERWPFASDSNSVDVGNLLAIVSNCSMNGQNSSTHGYAASGEGTGNATRIQKYQFAASSNATSVGTLTGDRSAGAGQSSTTHGYVAGGPDTPLNVIEKWSFTSDGNSSDVGDLTIARNNFAGCQV